MFLNSQDYDMKQNMFFTHLAYLIHRKSKNEKNGRENYSLLMTLKKSSRRNIYALKTENEGLCDGTNRRCYMEELDGLVFSICMWAFKHGDIVPTKLLIISVDEFINII